MKTQAVQGQDSMEYDYSIRKETKGIVELLSGGSQMINVAELPRIAKRIGSTKEKMTAALSELEQHNIVEWRREDGEILLCWIVVDLHDLRQASQPFGIYAPVSANLRGGVERGARAFGLAIEFFSERQIARTDGWQDVRTAECRPTGFSTRHAWGESASYENIYFQVSGPEYVIRQFEGKLGSALEGAAKGRDRYETGWPGNSDPYIPHGY